MTLRPLWFYLAGVLLGLFGLAWTLAGHGAGFAVFLLAWAIAAVGVYVQIAQLRRRERATDNADCGRRPQ